MILKCGGLSKILTFQNALFHNSFWLISNRTFFDSVVMLDYNAASTAKSSQAVTCQSSLNKCITNLSLVIDIAHQCNLMLISVLLPIQQ